MQSVPSASGVTLAPQERACFDDAMLELVSISTKHLGEDFELELFRLNDRQLGLLLDRMAELGSERGCLRTGESCSRPYTIGDAVRHALVTSPPR